MVDQREKDDSKMLKAMQELARNTGGFCSGQMIENFRYGWAKQIFGGDKSHHWVRDGFDGVLSLCKIVASVRSMYGEGNYPRCKTCVRILAKSPQ